MLGRVVVVACLCALGCAADENAAATWCGAVCAAQVRCGRASVHEQCRNECIADRPVLANRSAEGTAAEAPCLATLSCAAFLDDETWAVELDACWDQAKLSIEVTPAVRAFCADYAQVWFECGYSFSIQECERVFGMWAVSVLQRLASCVNAPTCDGLRACERAAF